MSEHEKLPWKVTDGNRNGDVYIGSENQHHFIIVENSPFSGGDVKANAELIVRACNSHETLLDACKFAKAQIKKGAQKKALPILRAAIAKTKENQP